MAFVFRSSKNLEEQIKPNNNLNFYENLNLLNEIYKKYSNQNTNNKFLVSFGTKSLRKSLNFKDGSDSPGPGSYRLNKSFLKKSYNQNLTSPTDPDGLEGEPGQLFISKDKRFKELNKNNRDNPSPDQYFREKNTYEENNAHKDLSHLKTFGKYYPFSKKRQISIPTNDLYYEIKDDGEIEVKTDLEKNKNNLGPGSYNIGVNHKKNNSIDWSKTVKEIKVNDKEIKEKEKEKEKNDKKDLGNIKLTKNNTFNESSNLPYESSFNINSNTSTNLLTQNIERYADKICNTEIINQKLKNKKKDLLSLYRDNLPGPGEYDTAFNLDAPINFSNVNNFGSNQSRGLLFPLTTHKIRIGLKNKKTSLIIKNDNKKENDINNNNINKSFTNYNNTEDNENSFINKNNNYYKLHSLYVNDIKERYLKDKYSFKTKLGPGSYNPSFSSDKNKKESYIQNFNSLEKRFVENKESYMVPGVGTYSTINSFSPKKTYFKSIVPQNITQRNAKGISAPKLQETKERIYYEKHRHPCVGDYNPEMINSIEYKMYKILRDYSQNRKPCFNFGEKRFFEPKRKYEDENQVGKYNLSYKEKEMIQKNIPFSSNVDKNVDKFLVSKEKINNKHLGPGAYRYDSYFDWNKKSYNMIFA